MGKQSVSIKGTSVSNGNAVGNHVEQTLYMEDNLLPSPSELQAYKNIEPKIVDFLLESSTKEQAHRHKMDEEKMKVVKYTERKNGRMNWWGMFFAFLALILMVGLSALPYTSTSRGLPAYSVSRLFWGLSLLLLMQETKQTNSHTSPGDVPGFSCNTRIIHTKWS